MSDTSSNKPESESQQAVSSFSAQPTGFVETTFAETLGLSMHNAITNQQSSQMTTSASITNACARLLQVPNPVSVPPAEKKPEIELPPQEESTPEKKPKKRLNVFNFLKKKKTDEDSQGAEE